MAIKFTKYIDITSGVGGAAAAARRDMGLRVFTTNPLLTYGSVLVCNDADEVMGMFGSDSEEYQIASNYFGYISNSITKANQISFVRWANESIKETTVTAINSPAALTSFTGDVGIRILLDSGKTGGVADPNKIVDVAISIGDGVVAESYDSVASLFTTAIAKKTGDYSWLNGAAVEYIKGRFVCTFTAEGSSAEQGPDVSLGHYGSTETPATDAIGIMGFFTPNAWVEGDWSKFDSTTTEDWAATEAYVVGDWVKHGDSYYCCKVAEPVPSEGTKTWDATNWNLLNQTTAPSWSGEAAYSKGDIVKVLTSFYGSIKDVSAPVVGTTDRTVAIPAEAPVEAVSRVEGSENNFGSFMFVETLDVPKIKKLGEWAHAKNYEYMYFVSCTNSGTLSYDNIASNLNGYTCVNMTYCNRRSEFPEFMPAALFASTDYTRVNSTKTFMFKQFAGVNPSVGLKNDPTVNGNALYKVLDSARVNYYGQTMKSGKSLCFYQDGNNADGTETSVACNEIWMKDAIKTELINLLIAMEKVPANDKGLAMVTMQVQGVINEAIANGTIIAGKTLTNTQKQYIDSVSGTSGAWQNVYNSGYWFGISLKTDNSAGYTKYKADYTLIYSKGDAIRKVTGSDIMI